MRKITEINITKLWGDPDLNIHWKLNPDVNVLAGDNGSGKSTVLELVTGLLMGSYSDKNKDKAQIVEIIFDTKERIVYRHKNTTQTVSTDVNGGALLPIWGFDFSQFKGDIAALSDSFAFINTFDQPIHSEEAMKKVKSFENVKTYMDFELFFTKETYGNYTIRIGNLAAEALFETNGSAKKMKAEVRLKLDRKNSFFDKVDELFKYTNKKINRTNDGNIAFTNTRNEIILLEQLSSGEKQLLHILLTALASDDKPMIIFLDEPEISLHVDWQQALIKNIMDLNPNIQLIIATHSPFIIADGWTNKVTQMDKITFKSKEEV